MCIRDSARLERKAAIPQLDTLLKVAAALDYELELVPTTRSVSYTHLPSFFNSIVLHFFLLM